MTISRYFVKVRCYSETGEPEPWSPPIEFKNRWKRDEAANVYVRVGGLEVECYEIHREIIVEKAEAA
jgi:hypothetical protein